MSALEDYYDKARHDDALRSVSTHIQQLKTQNKLTGETGKLYSTCETSRKAARVVNSALWGGTVYAVLGVIGRSRPIMLNYRLAPSILIALLMYQQNAKSTTSSAFCDRVLMGQPGTIGDHLREIYRRQYPNSPFLAACVQQSTHASMNDPQILMYAALLRQQREQQSFVNSSVKDDSHMTKSGSFTNMETPDSLVEFETQDEQGTYGQAFDKYEYFGGARTDEDSVLHSTTDDNICNRSGVSQDASPDSSVTYYEHGNQSPDETSNARLSEADIRALERRRAKNYREHRQKRRNQVIQDSNKTPWLSESAPDSFSTEYFGDNER